MLEQVRRTIAKFGLLRGGERVIIGFSGGIDSVCLTHVLKGLTELDLELWAVYVGYGLRPAENRREEALLQEYGSHLGIKTARFDVNIPDRLREKKESIQLLAREERYRIFRSFREEIGADKIALAHQRDDQAETILFRLIRGTGLDGLAGIPVLREEIFIRPLLEVSRDEIRRYVTENQLSWVEDSSNQKLIYRRNRIRHQLIPEIETTFNPRFKEALLRLGGLAGEQQELMASLAAREAERVIVKEQDRVGVRLKFFLDLPKYLQFYLLKLALEELCPGAQMVSVRFLKLRDHLCSNPDTFETVHFWKGFSVYREDGLAYLGVLSRQERFFHQVHSVAAPGSTAIPEAGLQLMVGPAEIPAQWSMVSDREVYFNAAAAKFPLQIRFWRRGDWFWPLGAAGTQKLQDYFTNCKVPRRKRSEIPLLVDAIDRIIWIAGYRLDDRFKVKASDREVWRAAVIPFES